MVGGLVSLILLVRDEHRFARIAAIGAVGGIVAAWGVAQWPYVIPDTMTVKATAAPSGTLEATIVAFVLACVFILPAIGLLYSLDQRDVLPEEGVEEHAEAPPGPAVSS